MAKEDTGHSNRIAWDGHARGHFEMYGLSLRHPESGHGLWLRFFLVASSTPELKSTAEVWALFFHVADPSRNFALRKAIPLVEASLGRDEFHLGVAEAWMDCQESRGKVESETGRIEWDFQFYGDTPCFRYFPYEWMYRFRWPKTKRLMPQPNARFNGLFQINGEEFRCQHAPGVQEHGWGTEHARRWVWTHCGVFDKSPETELTAYSMEGRYFGAEFPTMSVLHLKYRGEDILMNSPRAWFSLHSQFEPFFWYFIARKGRRDFVGEASVGAANVVGFQFKDPDGRRVFCYDSQFASVTLKVYEKHRGRLVEVDELYSKHAALFEYAQGTPLPGVPIHFSSGKKQDSKPSTVGEGPQE